MNRELPVYRSLTAAYQAAQRLSRAGIPCRVVNAPLTGAGQGCSYTLRVEPRYQSRAKLILG